MKTILAVVVLALPALCLADTVVPVDAVDSYVNIRQAPMADAYIIGRLHQGISLPLVETANGWNEVRLGDGASGFVSAEWTVVLTDEPAPEPAPETEPETEIETVVVEVAVEVLETEEPEEPVGLEEPAIPEEPAVLEEPAGLEEAAEPQAMQGPPGPMGPPGPPGPAGEASIKGEPGYVVKFKGPTVGNSSQIFDNGHQIGIGTTEPKQRLEVNGSIQIHERNSGVAGLMITQSSGDTGYIMHNRAGTLTIGAGSVDRITIDREGNVGIGVSRPTHALQMASGAHVTAGGVWTNSSSRAKKENINTLTLVEALAALAELEPVQFNYKDDARESHVGFIAEDVPDLVATGDRQGLSSMDIVAVLTRVIQAQQEQIEALEMRLNTVD